MATCSLVPRFAHCNRGVWVDLIFRLIGATTALGIPSIAAAAYSFNFPEPVTPIARETLHIHNEFMLIITFLFVTVFGLANIYVKALNRVKQR